MYIHACICLCMPKVITSSDHPTTQHVQTIPPPPPSDSIYLPIGPK